MILTNKLINIDNPLLTVKEILNSINYQYNDIFLDRVWQNIKDDIWITYMDIGYSDIDDNS